MIDHFGTLLALQPRKRFAKGSVLIVVLETLGVSARSVLLRSGRSGAGRNGACVIRAALREGQCAIAPLEAALLRNQMM